MRKWKVGDKFYVVGYDGRGKVLGVEKWEVTNVGTEYLYGCEVGYRCKTEHQFKKDDVFETIEDTQEAINLSQKKLEINKEFSHLKLCRLLRDANREEVDSLILVMRKLGFEI